MAGNAKTTQRLRRARARARCGSRAAITLAIDLKELPARAEECRVGRVHLLLQRWTQVRRDADERAETHGLHARRNAE
eukprot:6187779-Pleurochrysis_carterae.AAC.2